MQDIEAISRHARRARRGHRVLLPPCARHSAQVVHAVLQRREGARTRAQPAGAVETDVRDACAASRSGACASSPAKWKRKSARTLDSGRDYLQVKKRLHEQTVAPPGATKRAINGALRSLGRTRVENAQGDVSSTRTRAPVRDGRIVSCQGEAARRMEEARRSTREGACRRQGTGSR